MEFRRATADDVDQILPMLTRHYALHVSWDRDRYLPREGFEAGYGHWMRERAADDRSVFFVAVRGIPRGFVIGTVEREIPVYVLREFGFIHDLWVDDGYRNEGVGRQLATLAVEAFAAMGVKQVRLETAAANDAARGLFASLGFRVSSIDMMLVLP